MLTAMNLKEAKSKAKSAGIGSFWHNLSRKVKSIILLTALIPVIFLLYIFIGSPTFTIEQHYRRIEKANLVGPAEILDILELENYSYDRLLLADDEEGIIMYVWNEDDDYLSSQLIYREKQGDVSVYAAPCSRFETWEREQEINLPVFIFDNFPKAVRAELDLEINYTYGNDDLTRTYSLETTREKSGYFQFTIHAGNSYALRAERHALQILSLLTGHESEVLSATTVSIPATVRLYDESDNLLHESTVLIRSIEGDAHAKRGDLK